MNKELKMGIKVEYDEHGKTVDFIKNYFKKNKKFPNKKIISTHIAKDHLKEDKKYYTKIKKLGLWGE